MAHVSIRQAKSGLGVVALLGHDAVQSDVVPAQPAHGGLPHAQAVALAAKFRAYDVEADEAVAPRVGNRRDAADRLAVQLADQEAARIGREETPGVVEPRVPSFASGEVDRER